MAQRPLPEWMVRLIYKLLSQEKEDREGKLKTIDDVYFEIEELWEEGRIPRKVGRGSVQRCREKWIQLPVAVRRRDQPFEWNELEEYGLPWEAGNYLLQMWVSVKEGEAFKVMDARFVIPPPTVRQARWWWRVHLAAPDLRPHETWCLAQRFSNREVAYDLLNKPFHIADLEAHLAYRPWESPGKLSIYRKAIGKGAIPAISVKSMEWFDIATELSSAGAGLNEILGELIAEGAQGVDSDVYPELFIWQQDILLQNYIKTGEYPAQAIEMGIDIWDRKLA